MVLSISAGAVVSLFLESRYLLTRKSFRFVGLHSTLFGLTFLYLNFGRRPSSSFLLWFNKRSRRANPGPYFKERIISLPFLPQPRLPFHFILVYIHYLLLLFCESQSVSCCRS
ncbi:hypothetical protein K435DRAFT_526994 [Dendrothele bispora CBS 962.96]|uniref:Uncharacterized protein n=1 Tax=Dendrothele bispora (strain CBS 962.96) TaxID=1314807 RepID=A0A4S8M8E4_DENBC|nr:hypothetical protein K435DRAFT_526994 [Dendrothele bispora CBS 962.96]